MPKGNDLQKITLKDVRISYPTLFSPRAFEDGQDKYYSCQVLANLDEKIGKRNRDLFMDAVDVALDEHFTANGKKIPKVKDDKKDFYLGDDRNDELDEEDFRPEIENHFCVVARNKRAPLVLDRDKTELDESDDVIYPGCRVDVIVRIWIQDNKYGVAIRCSLEAVRFRRDDDSFGAAPVTADDFDDDDDDDIGDSRSSRKRRSRDEDDDDDRRSSRKRRSRDEDDDDDEDDRRSSRKRRRRDEDDDDDEEDDRRSSRKRRSRDEDDDDDDDEDDRGSRRKRRRRDEDEDDDEDDRGSRRKRRRRNDDDDDGLV